MTREQAAVALLEAMYDHSHNRKVKHYLSAIYGIVGGRAPRPPSTEAPAEGARPLLTEVCARCGHPKEDHDPGPGSDSTAWWCEWPDCDCDETTWRPVLAAPGLAAPAPAAPPSAPPAVEPPDLDLDAVQFPQPPMTMLSDLFAALAEAEERARTHEHNALMQRNEGVRLLARAESAERARDGWQEEARTYCQNATFQREKRDAAEASLAQARAECDAARAGLENQARDYTRRCEQLAQAREVLRDVEWAQKTTRLKDGGTIYTAVTCPCCGGEKDPPKRHRYKEPEPVGGHAPGCALASALGRGK